MDSKLIVVVLLLVLCATNIQGASISVYFSQSDVKGSEGDNEMQVEGTILGDNIAPVTVRITPLTVQQYQTQPDAYEHANCSSLINTNSNTNQAEENDFDTSPIELTLPSNISDGMIRSTFSIPVRVIDDTINEPEEYFLLLMTFETQGGDTNDVLQYVSRRCSVVKIRQDTDDTIRLTFSFIGEPELIEGTTKNMSIIKHGQTELDVSFSLISSGPFEFSISHQFVTLHHNETETTILVTAIEDDYLEELRVNYTITAGHAPGSPSVKFVIIDNDYVSIGFNETEFTVVEGETIHDLTAIFINSSRINYLRSNNFRIFTENDTAFAPNHYQALDIDINFFYADRPFNVVTIDDNILEKSRKFFVKIGPERGDPGNPLNVLSSNTITITITDNDGIPNAPNISLVGIILGVVLAILLCCICLVFVIILCLCWANQKEKQYLPARTEKEHEKNLKKYRAVRKSSESDIREDPDIA